MGPGWQDVDDRLGRAAGCTEQPRDPGRWLPPGFLLFWFWEGVVSWLTGDPHYTQFIVTIVTPWVEGIWQHRACRSRVWEG